MSEQAELKSCPFCGGEPHVTKGYWSEGGTYRTPIVRCASCGAETHAGRKVGDPDAIESWNRRDG